MQVVSVVRRWSFLLCGGAAALLPACDAVVLDGEGGGDEAGDRAPPASSAESALAGCTVSVAGGGFTSQVVPTATSLSVTELEATALGDPALDGVFSLSSGVPTSFNHLATAVRFSTAGVLDVRDGSAYRADTSISFVPGQPFKLRIVADVPTHTFSVYVDRSYYGYGGTERLAKGYAFRPTTASVTSLDRLSSIVDGAAGELSLCNVTSRTSSSSLAFSRAGSYGVVPLANDLSLISDGSTVTMRLAANGAVLNQIAVGGEIAADPSERAYVARVTGSQLALNAYTSTLALRWSRLDPVASGSRVLSAAADAAGVTLALAGAGGAISIVRYPAAGGAGTVLYTGGTHAALAADGFAVATATSSAYDVAMFASDGTRQWTQSFPGAIGASIEVMTLGLGGRVVLGGHFYSAITFGGPTLELAYNGEVNVNTYLVGLDRTGGAHVFTNRVNATHLTGAAGNGARLAVTGERWVTPIFPDLWQYDASGTQVASGAPSLGFLETWGRSGRIAIGASNRIYWERSMVWPAPTSTPYPYLHAVSP